MARHSNGKNSFALAPWLIAVLAVIAVAVVAALIWFFGRAGGEDITAAPASSSVESSISPEASTQTTEASAASATPTSTSSAQQTPTSEAAPSSAASASEGVADTLFLVDTSDAMTARADAVAQAVGEAARAVSAQNKGAALWNYSSPLSSGVTVGYRNNLGFGSGEEVATSVAQLGNGGVPQTRSAVIAALATASDQAAATGSARVVLITSGTEQDMDDAAFTSALEQAKGTGVTLSVVQVGDGEADAALKAAADKYVASDEVAAAVSAAAGV